MVELLAEEPLLVAETVADQAAEVQQLAEVLLVEQVLVVAAVPQLAEVLAVVVQAELALLVLQVQLVLQEQQAVQVQALAALAGEHQQEHPLVLQAAEAELAAAVV